MEYLCSSANTRVVFYEKDSSHAATHFADTPELKPAVIKAIESAVLSGDEIFIEYDMGRVIGTTDLVMTTDADTIIYAKRKNRDNYTRFTTSQHPQPCSTITLLLQHLQNDNYLLWSAWLGYKGPSFPDDPNATSDSKEYWSKHALVWGKQQIIPGTETNICPW